MKILFAIKSLSTLGGGAERVFVDIANGLHLAGADISVMTFEPVDAGSFYALNPDIERLDVGARSSGKRDQLALLPTVRRKIVDHAPDVVVAFMPSSYVPLAAALALSGIPVVASEHNVPERYRRQPLRWLSILISSVMVRGFTAVSSQMRQAYPPLVRRKMTVLPNPVSVPTHKRADVMGETPATGLILSVGRLHEQKDHATLIHAFAMLAADFPGWTLRILGDGTEREALEQEIARMDLDGRVALAGTVRDIGAEYSAAQLYATASRYESFGLATVEAIAHGLPAIGFADCPGTNEVILDGHNGLLVAPGTDRVGALSAALRRLMADATARAALVQPPQAPALENSLPSVLEAWQRFLREVAPHAH